MLLDLLNIKLFEHHRKQQTVQHFSENVIFAIVLFIHRSDAFGTKPTFVLKMSSKPFLERAQLTLIEMKSERGDIQPDDLHAKIIWQHVTELLFPSPFGIHGHMSVSSPMNCLYHIAAMIETDMHCMRNCQEIPITATYAISRITQALIREMT
jgi:hypothetical protein